MKPPLPTFPAALQAALNAPVGHFNLDKLTIRQIFYNQATRDACDPAYVPLDNSDNLRPDWYELWPILQFFRSNPPQDGQWYGFLSPKFTKKMNLDGTKLMALLASLEGRPADSISLLKDWDQTSWFQNVFFQGEHHHKGILPISQAYLNAASWPLYLDDYIGHTANTVFSHYLVASDRFWRLWVYLAESLVAMVDTASHPLNASLKAHTAYGAGRASRFVFIQERLPNVILALPHWLNIPVVNRDSESFIFSNDAVTRAQLALCDDTKKKATPSNSAQIKAQFLKHRRQITPLPHFFDIQDK
jgi:hypothetical protein